MSLLRDLTTAFVSTADQKAPNGNPLSFNAAQGLAPAPVDREQLVFGRNILPGSSRFAAGGARRQLEAYAGRGNQIDWAMACLDLLGDTAAQADWYLETPQGKRLPRWSAEAEKSERTAPASVVSLIHRPNPWMTYPELVKLTIIDWFLTGDCFWLKFRPNAEGQPNAFYRLNPGFVEVMPDPDGEQLIGAYKYHVPGMEPVFWAPQDMFHIKRPNPHDPHRGVGIVQGAARTLDMELALQNTKASYYENGARLSGVLESDHAINDGVIQKLRRQFTGMYTGTDAAYKVAVLERGLKFNAIQNNAAEAEFGSMSTMSRDRIFAMFRTPPSLLFQESEHAVRGNTEEDRRNYANGTVRPALNGLQEAVSLSITEPGWGLKFCIEYEYQMPIEAQIELASTYAALPGVRLREVREFAGLDPLGDARDELVLNMPGENDNGSEVKDRNLGPEAGRPPKGENTKVIPKGAPPKDSQAIQKPSE